MGIATKIPQNTFEGLQVDAGVLVTTFDPAEPAITDASIICATTGGITVSCVPTYSDYGEDVDNCPNNTKELKRIDGWDCKVTTTGLGTSLDNIKLALGAADITSASSKVAPRRQLAAADFTTVWWVGDRADGGLVAVKIINAECLTASGGRSFPVKHIMQIIRCSLINRHRAVSLNIELHIVQPHCNISHNCAARFKQRLSACKQNDYTGI